MIDKTEQKLILDACCGPKMMWFNKNHPNTIYIDQRKCEKGYNPNRYNREINPDAIMDFRDLKFPNKSFKLVVMDPPHLNQAGEKMIMRIDFGMWNKQTWKEDLKKGFDECWRVLDDFGVLIFKWNETQIKKKEVLQVLERQPLFGHPVQSKIPTHWFCFMKIPSEEQLIAPNQNSASQVVNDEHNISLKDNSNELSQISSNDETSLNNNITK